MNSRPDDGRETDLQDLALEIFEVFGFDAPGCDAGETEQSQDGLHVCALRNQILDGRYLRGDLV
jgi:hypothetical protein